MRIGPAARASLIVALAARAPAVPAHAQAPTPAEAHAAAEFFEARIRPVLADRCWGCHGPEKQKGGLRLDSRAAALEGGADGPSVVPGDPAASPLVRAVRHEGDHKMPPKDRLPEEAVRDLSDWVRAGAPWPAAPSASAASESTKAPAAAHWAFRPVVKPEPPAIARAGTPVDAFVLAALEARGLSPSPRADKRTLIRRAAFDLTGLPPTPGEVDAFLADAAPDAFARLVDRLLASPAYGERWGRIWLDVARYADTKGYVFQEERRYANAYTYRDYVIRAFNEDKPYDLFIVEQLAADKLPRGDDTNHLAAMGFLTVGRRFLNDNDDIIDDRIDVVTRGLMGLTVSCARCHDHKFDPIPTEDYYSLHGVFNSSTEPAELPEIRSPAKSSDSEDYRRQLQARRDDVAGAVEKARAAIGADLRARVSDYYLASSEIGLDPGSPRRDEVARSRKLSPERLRLAASRWKAIAAKADRDPSIPGPDAPRDQAESFARRLDDARLADDFERAYAPAFGLATTADADPIRKLLAAADGPVGLTADETNRAADRAEKNKLMAVRKRVAELDATHPGAPARAMVMVDKPQPVDPHVYLRGNPGRPGKPVPRRFLAALSKPDRTPFAQGSGRLELARAIASPANPLTARVMVNRVWMHHFASPLVMTPGDFGVRSDPPTHPELLDWLASRFVEGGWSVKALHRTIMLADAYQQASDPRPEALAVDSQNRLLWRQNRRRLDFESMRDGILAVSGTLDPAVGGRPVALTTRPFATRRTVYGLIDRQNLEGLYRTFDFASPDATSARRFVTTVPQQALFLMNSPFVAEQARALARRSAEPIRGTAKVQGEEAAADEDEDDEDDDDSARDAARVARLYRALFGRPPEPREVELAARFLDARAGAASESESPWQLGYGAYDEDGRRVAEFRPMTTWTGRAWQLGPKLPSAVGSFLHLTAEGGHAGPDARFAAVRRWIAPRDATIAISGTLSHPAEAGDGVRARVVAGRGGPLGSWAAHRGTASTTVDHYQVARGEAVDFVVDCRVDDNSDSFSWAPAIRLLDASATDPGPVAWDSRADFSGPMPPPLSPWESYTQVLLMSNEFLFVD